MATGAWPSSGPKAGSLTAPVARHLAVFLIAVGGALALSRIGPGVDQPLAWLLGGLAIGFACGVVGGGWMGLLFVVAGLWIGLWFDPDRQAGPAAETLDALSEVGPAYVAVVIGACAGYAVALLVLRRLRESGLIQRPSR